NRDVSYARLACVPVAHSTDCGHWYFGGYGADVGGETDQCVCSTIVFQDESSRKIVHFLGRTPRRRADCICHLPSHRRHCKGGFDLSHGVLHFRLIGIAAGLYNSVHGKVIKGECAEEGKEDNATRHGTLRYDSI